MSDGQRPKLEWMIKVNGVEETRLGPGQTIEIGRKPLRPLSDDGRRRLDVPDDTKSMSKRHALFTFDKDGSATLRDMGSTNGSYMVQADGSLVRLPSQSAFLLPGSSVRFQFGDVPVDFIQVEAPTQEEAKPGQRVPDLFSYARDRKEPVEPDATGMSVDDILDMRAGEPTGIFRADGVRNRVSALHDMALGEGQAEAAQAQVPLQEAQTPAQGDRPAEAQPQSRVQSQQQPQSQSQQLPQTQAHAPDQSQQQSQNQSQVQPQPQAQQQSQVQGPVQAGIAGQQQVPTQSGQASQQMGGLPVQPVLAQAAEGEGQPPVERNLFDDARNSQTAKADAQGQAEPAMVQPQAQPQPAQSQPAAQPQPQTSAQQPAQGGSFQPLGAVELARLAQQDREAAGERQAAAVSQTGDEPAYRPAFEPGSVFERVSKGDYGNQEKAIEVDGMSSDDAKRTSDFALQFEMAKHPQLLPFLAMNPALYDDLYAWLSAQGNEDIDAALQGNEGYHEYLNATGK